MFCDFQQKNVVLIEKLEVNNKKAIHQPLGLIDCSVGAGDRSRTNNLLITNQLLCH